MPVIAGVYPERMKMESAVLTFTQHYTDVVNTKYGTKTKNTFVTDDGQRFESWNSGVAAKVAAECDAPPEAVLEDTIAFAAHLHRRLFVAPLPEPDPLPELHGAIGHRAPLNDFEQIIHQVPTVQQRNRQQIQHAQADADQRDEAHDTDQGDEHGGERVGA